METAGLWNDAAFLRGQYGHSSTAFCWLQVAAEQAGVVFLLHGGVFRAPQRLSASEPDERADGGCFL